MSQPSRPYRLPKPKPTDAVPKEKTVTDDEKQRLHSEILTLVRSRVAVNLHLEEADIPDMTLGRLMNLLFLVRGHNEDLGGFSSTMAALCDLVGPEAIWQPQSEKKTVTTVQ
jgi:hypothetical protein